jgi:fatty-acid desaturase
MKKITIDTHGEDIFNRKIHKKIMKIAKYLSFVFTLIKKYIQNKSIMTVWIAKYTKTLHYTLHK